MKINPSIVSENLQAAALHRFYEVEAKMDKEGPVYPELGATVARYRRIAAFHGSIKEMPKADRRAYADAIEKAIRAKHRTLHMRPTPSMTPNWYKPPSITRLLHYDNPLPMVGDPNHGRDWNRRSEVYKHMMKLKRGKK